MIWRLPGDCSKTEPVEVTYMAPMNLDGQHFLQALASLPTDTFESRFAATLTALGLAQVFDRNELTLLYEASVKALACNLAINGIGMPEERIRPQDEVKRNWLEREFMIARDLFFASPGWQNLDNKTRQTIEEAFLTVFILNDRLAR